MEKCAHEKFECFCRVGRITDGDNGPVTDFMLDVKVQCIKCKEFFEFIGVSAGSSFSKPMTNIDFTELSVPIRPSTGKIADVATYTFEKEKPSEDIN